MSGFEPLALRSDKEMKDVLMDPEASGPPIHYYMIRGGTDKRNITVWTPGTVGGEYIKAYGHYHIDDLAETYEVIFGSGILLTQKRMMDSQGVSLNDSLEFVKAVFVKKGDVVNIPPKVGHLMINTGSTWLATSDDSPVALSVSEKSAWPKHADYKPVKELQGFGYYVVEENNQPKFIKNPKYKVLPDIQIEYLN